MADRVYDAGVDVKLGHAADVDAIATGSFDQVVVATGSHSFIPDVPFAPVPYIWSDQYDLKIQMYGLPRGADSFAVVEGSLEDRKFVAHYGKGGVVCAAVGINMVRAIRNARALVAAQATCGSSAPQSVVEK
jgi:hypothetical protein